MASPVIMDGAITSKGLAAVAKLFNASKTARPPLLIATNVRLRKWLASGLDGRHFGVCLEGTYDRRCNPKDPSTRVSIFIVGNLGWKHQAGVSKMLGQLYRQQTATLRTYIGWGLYAGGGHVRRPDLLVLREDGAPCMILELDHKHRSLTQMAERLSGYLVAYTTMRMTIGVKLFGAQSGDPFRFAAVALQFGCDADGHPQLVYAASIGSAPLTPQDEADTRAAIGDEAFAAMDQFEDGVANEAALQHATWKYAAMDCPQLSIQMSDVVTSTVPDLAPTNERLVIDLYKR
ncbi:hypothetical protein SDRG_12445 [Saprolegnia diclina VS20]|uniref:Uncharacterized protein n=1 Tax=Saprolegnia diclina (strain VS20) TaxID=1156394 RepID=T0Q5N3_SAPDV|nr:hypothetical protein SDRG_12445 [Saprolegnia diclina VS20]EQC29901.1 hypothetical protein SDRG_12445 [Saprolegnia diclina VS20]|eukprot:XP_008616740.1 hypothetical protein SDRG_12445 [Saprolegnia diclina VS20]